MLEITRQGICKDCNIKASDGLWDSDKGKYLIHQNLLEVKYNQFDHDD